MGNKWKLLVTLDVPEIAIEFLKDKCEIDINRNAEPLSKKELIKRLYDKHALCCGAEDIVDDEVINNAPMLKAICRFGVGFDKVDVYYATKMGIKVTNTPNALTESVAEMTWGLLLALARKIVLGDKFVRSGSFKKSGSKEFQGVEINKKTLGVIGAGKIGTAVGRIAQGYSMTILYYDSYKNINLEKMGAKKTELKELLSNSDFVTLHVPLNENTYHLIGQKELGLMKKTAYLLNTSRGKVIDEEALVFALTNESIAGAALDVYENEPNLSRDLINRSNVILTPHIASTTKEAWDKMAVMMAHDCLKVLNGEEPLHLVNP
jgi:glyoxylate reductase